MVKNLLHDVCCGGGGAAVGRSLDWSECAWKSSNCFIFRLSPLYQTTVSCSVFLHQCTSFNLLSFARTFNLSSLKSIPRSSWHMERSTMSYSSKQKSSLCPTYVPIILSFLHSQIDHAFVQQRSSNRWRWGILHRRCA